MVDVIFEVWTIFLDGVFEMRSHQSTVKRYENLLCQIGKNHREEGGDEGVGGGGQNYK